MQTSIQYPYFKWTHCVKFNVNSSIKESMLKSKASEILDFINMADLYKQIVEHVRKLSCAPLLMPQFAKDLADSAHLARSDCLS